MLDNKYINLLEQFRKELHQFPEISCFEYETQSRIIAFLKQHSSGKISKIGKTGVIVSFESTEKGDHLLFRADTDALPIQEVNTFSYRSKNEGVSHKCGHDGHTSILLGLAIYLSQNPIQSGKVSLLFQPAEENGEGAKAVINDELFPTDIDFVYALHNLPGFEKNEIVVKQGEFTSNVKSCNIKLFGKTAHAAEPEKGLNPAEFIQDLLLFASRNTHNVPSDDDFFLITPIYLTMGEKAYGISAGYGEVHLTIRSWSTKLMQEKCAKLISFCEILSKNHHIKHDIEWFQEFYANVNNIEAVNNIKKAANEGQLSCLEINNPFKWGEDFGLFTQEHKGAMFGLGSGINTPALHNPDYDFPDDITPAGINLFSNLVKIHLNS